MSDLIKMMRSHVAASDAAENAAADLWTWLPSYKAAEASLLMASIATGKPSSESIEWAGCPCGECSLA